MQNIFTHWESVINFTRNDIVFEYQNKKYGAYVIRKYYPERLRNAFIYTLLGTTLLFAVPLLFNTPDKIKLPADNSTGEYFFSEPPITIPEKTAAPEAKQPIKQHSTENLDKFKFVENIDDKKLPDLPPDAPENLPVANNVNAPSSPGNSREPVNAGPVISPPPSKPEIFVDEMPAFAGGDPMLDKFLRDNIKYPPVARENGIEGKVYVAFVVDKEGKIKDAKVVRGIGGGCEEEALRVVRLMPDWKPGKNRGYPVDVQLTLPIKFVLR